MKPSDEIPLIGGLLDLPILDKDYAYCGIVDDIELEEGDGAPKVKALLVGPGAWRGRLPGWAYRIARRIAGDRITRVPWEAIEEIGSAVVLKITANAAALHRVENRAGKLIPHGGAL